MSGKQTTRTPEIEAVFDEAMELPPDRRDAWLAARCGADDQLRGEVEALLSGLDHAERFFDRQKPAISHMARELLTGAAELRIGQYHVLRELGRGGMGVVYLAERADGHHRRRVAIKVVRLDDERKDIQRRFLAEGHILASLSHPNIAQLLDAGVMDDGSPYIVMEYVDGATITAYCEHQQLTVAARLKLFQDVCAAIHHAHTNLVLHRDVKPGNILVTRDGRVKLLDFGIAKLLEGDAAGDSARDHPRDVAREDTRTGARPMTPAYASPEQIRGEPLTTASDVYALGLVLYEILAGVRAYDVEAHPPAAALALISDKEPPLPSTRGSRHSAELRDDLDAIVMMALRKEAGQRYGSADQLSADIGRFLDGLPVRAHADNRLYRLRRFVRRHRVAVLSTVLLFAGVAGGLSVATWQAREASRARDQAMAAHDESEQVSDFVIGLFDNRDDYGALRDTLVLQSFLARGMKRLDDVREPLARASLLDALGRVQLNLQNVDEAERLMWQALALREEHAGRADPATARTLERLSDVQRRRGNYPRADSLAARALEIHRAMYGNVHPRVAFNLDQRAALAVYLNDLARAESLSTLSVAAVGTRSPESDSLIVGDIETLASIRARRGNIDGALASMREAERLARQRHAYPDPIAAGLMLHRAELISHVPGRSAEAGALARQAMAEWFAAVPPGDQGRAVAMDWAASIIAIENPAEGIEMQRASIALRLRAFSPRYPPILDAQQELAVMLLRSGQTAEATTLLRDVVAHMDGQYGARHTAYAGAIGYLADALMQAGAVDSAEKLVKRAIAIRTATFGTQATITALSSLGLARVAAVRGDTAAADSIYNGARTIILRQTTPASPDVRFVDSLQALLHVGRDDVRGVRLPVLRRPH